MRELLGGKGANVAEMTRVLGAERVPAGFTITTEACVAYMEADRTEPAGLEEQVAEALGGSRSAGRQSASGRPDDPLLVSVRSGARESMPGMMDTVLNLGLNDESVVEGSPSGPATSGSPGTPTAASCRCSGTSAAGVPGEQFEDAIERAQATRRREEDTELSVDDLKELVDRSRSSTATDRRGLPAGPAGAAAAGDPRGVRLLDGRPRGRVPAHQPHPGRLGHRGERAADGVRQQGRQLVLRRRVLPRRDHRRARAVGDFLVNAQGEDVVSGVRTPRDISTR